MRKLPILFGIIFLISCTSPTKLPAETKPVKTVKKTKKEIAVQRYMDQYKDNNQPSTSIGTVSTGALSNGKLFPFYGPNFEYFDTLSYFNHRAFVNGKLKKTMLQAYHVLDSQIPSRKFVVMECSNKKGGTMHPHRTHQNGLSIDFMMPLIKGDSAYYELDTLGAAHYWLRFDRNGRYANDTLISIDLNLVARHLLILDDQARKNGLKISMVLNRSSTKDM